MTRLLALGASLALTTAIPAQEAETTPVLEAPAASQTIDLAICLDTSGSMEGLIDAARTRIWSIVNDLALAEPSPDLRVALLTFGNNGHLPEDGWVQVQTDFTSDLDLVSERLFGLATNGGEEYVGRVVDRAARQLSWHPSTGGLRLIIVAGNESADQDQQVSFRDACRHAIGMDIMVNSIYCGNPADDVAPGWREVAQLADGKFASIDQSEGAIVIATPFDDELTRLSTVLNETYLSYTAEGQWAQANQSIQDTNAEKLNAEASASRALTKCGTAYQCGWDLVTRFTQEPDFDLTTLDAEHLPEAMREMTVEEQAVYLQEKADARVQLAARMQEIGQQRQTYIIEESARQQVDTSRSFGFVIREAIRDQARSRGFVFAEMAVPEAGAPEAGPPTRAEADAAGDGC